MTSLEGGEAVRPSAMAARLGFERYGRLALVALSLVALNPVAARAERIANPVAVFAGLDKITGRIISFDVYMDETVQFGALQVTPRVCYTRPPTEAPQTDAFVEVDEITLNRKVQRIFTGWMFAGEPGPARRRPRRLRRVADRLQDVLTGRASGDQALEVAG